MKSGLILSLIIILASGIISVGQIIPGIKVGSYLQEVKTEIQLPKQADANVVKLFGSKDGIIAVTPNGVFRYRNEKWDGIPLGTGWITATLDAKGEVWLASVQSIQKEGDSKKIDLPVVALNDTILSFLWEDEKTLLVGTKKGLLTYNGNWNSIAFTSGKRVNSILKDAKGDLWLATTDGLLRRINGKWVNMDDDLMAYGLRRTYFTLESGNTKATVLFGGLFAVGCIADDGNHWLLRGADGLPYGPIKTIRTSKEIMWFGTDKGAIKKDQNWHYYNGKRWLPDNKVNDILPVDEHTVWIATPKGISQIQQVEMKLVQKAAAFEERIRLRHDRYGLVSGSRLLTPGDLSTSQTGTDDNDGLWTSIYLAAECYRYAVTKDPEARKNAIKAFEAMERLETVTGISGFPARSLLCCNPNSWSIIFELFFEELHLMRIIFVL